jgi:hypothetical protein
LSSQFMRMIPLIICVVSLIFRLLWRYQEPNGSVDAS